MCVGSYTPQELYSPQHPDVKHNIFPHTETFMGAFVAGWSKEFHSKEKLQHRSLGYNRNRYTCSNTISETFGT